MAVIANRVTVATTATELTGTDNADRFEGSGTVSTITVRNPTGAAATVTIGGAGVTTSTGVDLAAGEWISLDLQDGDQVYGIVASGTQAVQVLRTGV